MTITRETLVKELQDVDASVKELQRAADQLFGKKTAFEQLLKQLDGDSQAPPAA